MDDKFKKNNSDLRVETININEVIRKLLTNYVNLLFEEKLAKKYELLSCIDIDGNFIYACPNHRHAIGYASDELCKIRSFDIVHPEDRQKMKCHFIRLFEEKLPTELVYRIKHKQGHWIQIQSICTPYLAKGKVVALINFSNRFTEIPTSRERFNM